MNGEQLDIFSQTDAGSGQGDCVSSYLFSLCIQILIIKLSFSPSIDRFTLNYTNSEHINVEKQFLVISFADDCHIPLSPIYDHTLQNTLDVLQRFSELSDLILNVKKTELMAVGHQPTMLQNASDIGLEIVDKIKFVGSTTFNHTPELDSNRILYQACSKFTKITNYFTSKYSTTVGSVIALNSLCLSLFTHSLYNFIPEQ